MCTNHNPKPAHPLALATQMISFTIQRPALADALDRIEKDIRVDIMKEISEIQVGFTTTVFSLQREKERLLREQRNLLKEHQDLLKEKEKEKEGLLREQQDLLREKDKEKE